MLSFGTVAEAATAAIPSNINTLAIGGYAAPGDNGGGFYTRVASLPSYYVGDGTVTGAVPPSFVSGGPELVYSTTARNAQLAPSFYYGPTTRPILPGCLAFILVRWLAPGPTVPPSSITDSAGNNYTFACGGPISGNSNSDAFYYCTNPVFGPKGTHIANLTDAISGSGAVIALDWYIVPGFTGAVKDQALYDTTSHPPGVTSISVTMTTPGNQFVVGFVDAGVNPRATSTMLTIDDIPGWVQVAPPTTGHTPIACAVMVNSGSTVVTYAPTFQNTNYAYSSGVVTFSGYPTATLTPSNWALQPTWPVHTMQYGIMPSTGQVDNRDNYVNFSRWLASIAPPSDSIAQSFWTAAPGADWTPGQTCTISGSPAVVTLVNSTVRPVSINGTYVYNLHGLRQGQAISFDTVNRTDTLPAPLVKGQKYYIQYGSVTATSFGLSSTSIMQGPVPGAKGTSINITAPGTGTIVWTTYGETWTEIIMDPGIYYSGNNAIPLLGFGFKRWRIRGYGARIQSPVFLASTMLDINSNTAGTTQLYQAPFASLAWSPTPLPPSSIQLIDKTTGAASAIEAPNFYVNSWVVLMGLETQYGASNNMNNYYFEFKQIQAVDLSTGVISFYDSIKYNYKATWPKIGSPAPPAWSGGAIIGPATIIQLSDNWDQEIELVGLSIYGTTQETFAAVKSIRLVDCLIDGWAYKTGPSVGTGRWYIHENCTVRNAVMEVDKMLEYMLVRGCVYEWTSYLIIASASCSMLVIEDTLFYGGLQGNPKSLIVRNSYIGGSLGFLLGVQLGVPERMVLENSHIQYVSFANNQGGQSIYLTQAGISFSGGTVKVAPGNLNWTYPPPSGGTSVPLTWAIPGAKVCIVNGFGTSGHAIPSPVGPSMNLGIVQCFTVLDVYVDGSNNFCADTDLAALPSVTITLTGSITSGTKTLAVTAISPADAAPLIGMSITCTAGGTLPASTFISADPGIPNTASPVNTGNYTLSNTYTGTTITGGTFQVGVAVGTPSSYSSGLWFVSHPCPRATIRNCTGGQFVTDQVGAPSDIPALSYFKRAYDGLAWQTETNPANLPLEGNLKSWTINVTKPYSGSLGTFVLNVYMFGWKTVSGNTYPTWVAQVIDLKTAGLRTIGPTAATTTGGTGGPPVMSAGDALVPVPFFLSGTHSLNINAGTLGGGDTLANMPRFVMVGQADQGIDAATDIVKTANFGPDVFADTVVGVNR